MWVTQTEIFSNQSKYEAILSIVFNLPPDFFLKMWYDSIEKCFFGKFVAATATTSREKCVWRCFHLVANKGLIWIITTVSKIKPFAGDIFLHGKLVKCTGFIVWNFERIGNEFENHNFLIDYWNTINSFIIGYELLGVLKLTANYQNSRYKWCPSKQNLPHWLIHEG